MSFLSDIFTPSGNQTYDEAQANYASLQAQLKAQTDAQVADGTISPSEATQNYALAGEGPLQDPGTAAITGLFTGDNSSGADATTGGTGLGTVATDVLVLVAIVGGLWLFFELGGAQIIKKFVR